MNPFKFNIIGLVLCLLTLVRGKVHSGYDELKEHWGYHGEGNYDPEYWAEEYKKCEGKMQSPINIDNRDTIWASFDRFIFHHYKQTAIHIENNGHTMKVEFDHKDNPQVKGGGLNGIYEFAHLHFHWGSNSSLGSEHTIDDESYPMEMHMVHFKRDYGNVSNAVSQPDGLAVLGVLFKVTEKDNKALAPILKSLQKVEDAHTDVDISSSVPLAHLLPHNLYSYYRYDGSLTTPTCNEVVTWTVFTTPIHVSEKQLEMFRSLHTLNESIPLTDNFRPLQEVNGRKIYKVERELKREVLAEHSGAQLRKSGAAHGANYEVKTIICLVLVSLSCFRL